MFITIILFGDEKLKKIIIIKYAELSTKKDNINFFIRTLKNNIIQVLKDFDVDIHSNRGRTLIDFKTADEDKIISKLTNVFGIHEINLGYKIDTLDEDVINEKIVNLLINKDFNTFKVETKRSNKKFPLTSLEYSRNLGAHILKNKQNIKVDVHNPELLVNVEIKDTYTLVYFDKIKGLGGFPVSTLGKSLLMLSGGIDSPVAGYLANKRGIKLEAIYFESPPHTSEDAKRKVLKLAEKLSTYNLNIKVHVINFTEIQEAIYKNIPHEYLITIMRRMMYRISEKIAKRNNCHILINGESIGQVASQTLVSMKVINEVIKLPVIRPLACFDKLEIIDLAKKINTYETSILPFEDCCTIFVPKHPVINPESKLCFKYEELIEYDEMINRAIKNHEVIKVSTKQESKYEDIL